METHQGTFQLLRVDIRLALDGPGPCPIEIILDSVDVPESAMSFPGINTLKLPKACFLSETVLVFDNMYGSVRRAVQVDVETKQVTVLAGLAEALLGHEGGPCEAGGEWCLAQDACITVLDVSLEGMVLFGASAPNAPTRIGVWNARQYNSAVRSGFAPLPIAQLVTCGPASVACGVSAKVPMAGHESLVETLISDYYHIWTYNPRFYSLQATNPSLRPAVRSNR